MSPPPQSAEKEEFSNADFVSTVYSACADLVAAPTDWQLHAKRAFRALAAPSAPPVSNTTRPAGKKGPNEQVHKDVPGSNLCCTSYVTPFSFSRLLFLCTDLPEEGEASKQTSLSMCTTMEREVWHAQNAGETTKKAIVTTKMKQYRPPLYLF